MLVDISGKGNRESTTLRGPAMSINKAYVHL